MRRNRQSEYLQDYNAQAAVDAEGTQLVLSSHVTNCASDANELLPLVETASEALKKPKTVLADSGCTNREAVKALQKKKIDPYAAVSRDESHSKRKYEFRPQAEASKKVVKDPLLKKMQRKLQTEKGRKI